jgi:hypothetical protein
MRTAVTRFALRWPLIALLMLGSLSGCAVVAVVDTAASAVIGVGGLVVDAAVGTVRIGGKVVGAGADMVLGSASDE